MRKIRHHIDRVKEQPHHIRKQVAFTAAGGVTGFVAFVWLSASLATGSFAIQGSSFAESVGNDRAVVERVLPDGSQVAGAAAAVEDPDEPRIQIVDTTATTSVETTQPENTVIPF